MQAAGADASAFARSHNVYRAGPASTLQFDGNCGILWSQGEIPGKYGITKGAVTMRFQYTEKKVTLPESVHKYAEKDKYGVLTREESCRPV